MWRDLEWQDTKDSFHKPELPCASMLLPRILDQRSIFSFAKLFETVVPAAGDGKRCAPN
jgi:hypothetical protein